MPLGYGANGEENNILYADTKARLKLKHEYLEDQHSFIGLSFYFDFIFKAFGASTKSFKNMLGE